MPNPMTSRDDWRAPERGAWRRACCRPPCEEPMSCSKVGFEAGTRMSDEEQQEAILELLNEETGYFRSNPAARAYFVKARILTVGGEPAPEYRSDNPQKEGATTVSIRDRLCCDRPGVVLDSEAAAGELAIASCDGCFCFGPGLSGSGRACVLREPEEREEKRSWRSGEWKCCGRRGKPADRRGFAERSGRRGGSWRGDSFSCLDVPACVE